MSHRTSQASSASQFSKQFSKEFSKQFSKPIFSKQFSKPIFSKPVLIMSTHQKPKFMSILTVVWSLSEFTLDIEIWLNV
jgi:hypothetical protein